MSSRARKADTLQIGVSEALSPLLAPARYKGAYGGRGGAKSHFFAELLLSCCYGRETRAACIHSTDVARRVTPIAGLRPPVNVDLRTWPTRPGIGHFPEVVGVEAQHALGRYVGHLSQHPG